MHWFQGPQHWLDHRRLSREARHEPFTPRVPRLFRRRPELLGAALTIGGIAGAWVIMHSLEDWPAWMLFPSLLLSSLALVAMVVGLGILTVRSLEPALALRDLGWDAEPLAVLGIPPSLQRKCERIGYWTADDLARAVEQGRFPWTALELDERLQLERAAQRWQAVRAAQEAERPRRRFLGPR